MAEKKQSTIPDLQTYATKLYTISNELWQVYRLLADENGWSKEMCRKAKALPAFVDEVRALIEAEIATALRDR